MCSSAAAICPSSSSSSIGNCVLPRLKEQEGPSPPSASDEHNKDTGNSGHCKVKRNASEPALQCMLLHPKETKVNTLRRSSDSPKHYSNISSESTHTIETTTSSSSNRQLPPPVVPSLFINYRYNHGRRLHHRRPLPTDLRRP